MKEQARLTLERAIRAMDKLVPPNQPVGFHKAEAERIRPDEHERLREFIFSMQVVSAGVEGTLSGVMKVLVGENVLTPSLTNKGWMFWKPLLLTENEKRAIESAVIRYSEATAAEFRAMKNAFERQPQKDDLTGAVAWASLFDVQSSCIQQLSKDLKEILYVTP